MDTGSLITARIEMEEQELQTAGIVAGGETTPLVELINSTEEYDGSSWTAAPNMLTIQNRLQSRWWIQTECLVFGGR